MANILLPALPTSEHPLCYWNQLHGASVSLAISNAIVKSSQPILIIAPDSLTATRLVDEIHFFQPQVTLFNFPDWEILPYDHFSPHQDIISQRLAALNQLPYLTQGAVVTTVSTLLHKICPGDFLAAHLFLLKIGDQINVDILRTRLSHAGYNLVPQVREHGEFAIRGSIIDIYPMGSKQPFRLDLFDNEIETIRYFSIETQRSLEQVKEINLLPAKEYPLTEVGINNFRNNWRTEFGGNPLLSPLYQDVSEGIASPGLEYYLPLFFSQTQTLFDYLPANSITLRWPSTYDKASTFWQETSTRYDQHRHDRARPLLAPDKILLHPDQLQTLIKQWPQIIINSSAANEYAEQFASSPLPEIAIQQNKSAPWQNLQAFLTQQTARVLFCAESSGRREVLTQVLRNLNIQPELCLNWQNFITNSHPYNLLVAPLEEGFALQNPSVCVITETQLYGQRVMQRRLRKKTSQDPNTLIRDLTELQLGDAIVHVEHGVGKYLGLQTLTVSDQTTEFLTIEYQGGDKLYVPIANLHLVNRYTGSDPDRTPINKLGTEQWQKAKKRAAEKVRDVAVELLELYAKRAAREGYQYEIPEPAYSNFAAQFPFEETPDQLQAIEQVFADLCSNRPMDRVICGDVGFGKTEVALRAAFIAVQNNMQVVLLVPTTLLAQQHYKNFQDRLADWPIVVEMISRFKTRSEQSNVLQRLVEGKVDIVIGTHKLLQNDVKFKSLGLVIIDEEHRFGVKQKEKLKSLRANVDLLTLTATPIPRTLNMALAGIRDLSVIATPPAKRLAVKTFVHRYENSLVKEAVQRELLRGGQVYFLHNEVSTIERKADELRKLIPEARVTVAHGQMHERQLERVMAEFYHRHANVLVCSTIIESGIDIPTANTIIINRADKFGIAQLHQMRGRVGRSHHQAYAYLLIPGQEHLTADATKRLDAIANLGDLGIGFTLATHDLEIRGAGELLGEQQSGEIHEIGFSLYMDLLSRAVDSLKNGETLNTDQLLMNQKLDIELKITALIPDNYLPDVPLRLQFYKRIASAESERDLDEIQIEMIDRFGLLPQPLKNLFAISALKLTAQHLGITKIDANEKGGRIEFAAQPNVKPETIIRLLQDRHQAFKLEGPTKLRFGLSEHTADQRPQLLFNILSQLAE